MSKGETENAQEDHEDREADAEKDTRIDLTDVDSMRTGTEIQENLWTHQQQ